MRIYSKLGVLAAAAVFALPISAQAQEVKAGEGQAKTQEKPVNIISGPGSEKKAEQPVQKLSKKDRLDPQKRQQAQDLLKVKQQELKDLEAKAGEVTVNIGKLASSGKLTQDQDAIKLMQQMVDELKAIRERLDKMQHEIDGINGWIEGQNENLPIMQTDIASLKAHKEGNYVQFQFNDTNRVGGAADAFRLRRVRLGFTDTVAPNASMKVSFDLATGTNQLNAQLKDAFLQYDIVPSDVTMGTSVFMGQQNVPLGYEISRSSSAREFPERAQYNQSMFNGERGRGVQITHGLGSNMSVHAGIWNALSISDAEQANLAPGPGNKLAGTAGIRMFGTKYDVGLSGFFGDRPAYTSGSPAVTSPEVKRQFIYADATFIGLLVPELFLRAEAMTGRDRVPNATASPTRVAHEMYGYHVVLGYNIDPRNQLSLRYEEFDPNRDNAGDLFRGYGIAYNYFFGPNVRLTAAHEMFQDDARAGAPTNQRRYKTTTIRMQFKF